MWHPSESDLALAGDDLPRWKRSLVLGHLRKCERCRREAAEYAALPAELRELAADLPAEPAWLAARIVAAANVAAGFGPAPAKLKPAAAALAFALLVLLGLLLVAPSPSLPAQNYQASATPEAVIGETSGPRGRQRMVVYAGSRGVAVPVLSGSQAIEVSRTDPETGAVTITRIRMGDR